MDHAYKTRELGNSGEAYRRFRSSGLVGRANEFVFAAIRHRLVGGAIALMGAAGLIGWLVAFWLN